MVIKHSSFFVIHIIKCIRNSLIKKNNYFKHPTLALSNGERLEVGIFSMNWVKEFHKINKDKLISSCRVKKNTVNPDNLSKQKVKPALALFSKELTKALETEFGEKAKGTYDFLAFINKHVMQTLITTDPKRVFSA